MNEVIDVTKRPPLPVRFVKGLLRSISNALGQLVTRDFWLDLGARVIREMINAFTKTLGAKFLNFGISREDPEVKRSAQAAQQTGGASAFSSPTYNGGPSYGGSRYPSGSYGSDYNRNYPATVPAVTPPRTDAKFPGF